jgi:diguanylate cyclase (GGDEF)-like protein
LEDEKFKEDGVLAFIDIDDFKEINDVHGHLIGDKVLKLLAQTLKRLQDCFITRYAGDEFLVLSNLKTLGQIEEKLLTILKNLKSTGLKSGDSVFTISFSYGLSSFSKGENIKDIIEKADTNMYNYKNSKA